MKHQRIVARVILCSYLIHLAIVPIALANPTGPNVVGGHATVSGLGTSHVTITQASQRAIINWQQFNIAPNDVTQFVQPNVKAIALNRIFDQNPTQILGTLRANGSVILLNPNGVVFGSSAQVNVGGLIASSLNITNANFLAGHYLFEGSGIEGAVKNMGVIQGAHDGVYLLAPNVENSGVITAPGGSIVLAAGAKAYLSNRPDARGFLAEISAPVGHALNVKDLIADGGTITMAGRVVNQEGLVQANSVREKNGKIEIYASDTLVLKAGSQTMARGGKEGLSDGGTILAIADKFGGTAKFEKGATLDVSGGSAGGHAGFVELSGSRVALGGKFIGSANSGFRSGRLLIDPTMDLDLTGLTVTDFTNISFATPRDTLGNLLPDYDLQVTGFFDLNSVQPPATGGTIRFDAGRDLLFRDLTLWNNPFGTATKWDIVGVAGRNIQLTGTTLATAHGGSINLQAGTGYLSVIDTQTGALSTIRTQGGGGISIKTGQDLIASTGFDDNGGPLGIFNIKGITIDGPGRLNLDVGRDFIGGRADGVPRGPGFVLWNTDLTVIPQHTVTVGRNVGETNLILGPNGLPLTLAELKAQNKPVQPESAARYADFALSNGDLTVTAGGNIYLSRIRDAGLVGGQDALGTPLQPAFAAGFENNKATIVSRDGNVLINTSTKSLGTQVNPDLATLMGFLPASFEVRADKGTIQIRSALTFLPSPTGSVKFSAHQNIEGVLETRRASDDVNFFWLFVGQGGVLGGQWVAVDRRTLDQHPEYWPFLNKPLAPDIEHTRPSPDAFPDYAKIDVETSPHTVKLMEGNPSDIAGNTNYNALVSQSKAKDPVLPPENTTALAQVSFKAELGNISKLFLDLVSRAFRKEVSIEAGNRIQQVSANIYLPNLGTETKTVQERVPLFVDPVTSRLRPIQTGDVVLIRDPTTGIIRPWNKDNREPVDPANLVNVVVKDVIVTVTVPKVAATIKAQDINLEKGDSGQGVLAFSGQGTAQVITKGTLDLANGQGISMERNTFDHNRSTDQGGLLDIAVGNNLEMVTSGIFSQNGAGVSIHGYDSGKPYILGYDNSALYPSEFPDSVRGGINLPAVGGRVNVGENSVRSAGGNGSATGIQVLEGGSVGQMARAPVVNQDGTVTVSLVKDPASILIRATGDIDVNKSRIATFGGGDIRLTSVSGNINAGSGSKDERVQYAIKVTELDSDGKPKVDPSSHEIIKKNVVYDVPGSGIFTFHPNDPQPLVYPKFNDPQINAVLAEASRQRVLGRDVSQLEATANRLRAEREPVFNQTVLNPFIDRLKLGDIALTSERGSIIIPPAGIRGRNVTLKARFIDFRGGEVVGRVDFPGAPLFGGTISLPVLAPPGVAPPPPPLSGGGAAAASSATAAASSTSAKNSDQVQESASETSNQQAQSSHVASKKDTDKDGKSQLAKSVRVKRGVVIQVDVKPQAQSGS